MGRTEDLRELKEQYNLTSKQWKAIDLLSTQPGVTQEEVAQAVGISRQTLFNWRKSPKFEGALRAVVRHYVPVGRHAAIIEALVKGAQRGDPKMMKLYLSWRCEIDSGITINNEPHVFEIPTIHYHYGGGEDINPYRQLIQRVIRMVEKGALDPKRAIAILKDQAGAPAIAEKPKEIEAVPIETAPATPLETAPAVPEYEYDPPAYDVEIVPERELRMLHINGKNYEQRPGESDRDFTGRVRWLTKGAI